MVAVKQIGLEGLKEEEIAQLMHKVVDLVKRLSHREDRQVRGHGPG
jgi:hypothetical protein